MTTRGSSIFAVAVVCGLCLAGNAEAALILLPRELVVGSLPRPSAEAYAEVSEGLTGWSALAALGWGEADEGNSGGNGAATDAARHGLHRLASGLREPFVVNLPRRINTLPVPEPITLTYWGVGALALAMASRRRQKRGPRRNPRVQEAVTAYLAVHGEAEDISRMLSQKLIELASDRTWTGPEIEEFYDEVVLALHAERDRAQSAA
jgi:hypothetical protein